MCVYPKNDISNSSVIELHCCPKTYYKHINVSLYYTEHTHNCIYFDTIPNTLPYFKKHSLDHQMWINPPQKIVLNKCTISTCLSSVYEKLQCSTLLGNYFKPLKTFGPLCVGGTQWLIDTKVSLSGYCLFHFLFSSDISVISLLPFQDGSRGGSSGEEGRLQPPVWYLGCGHHCHRAGWAPTTHVWPPPNEVSQHSTA